ncbi:MAG: sugar ABC transporter ATP-binding protein, partial [Planctomycetota bacterium]
MDEPTSSLSSKESELLFQLIESLSEQGVSIIYISHRLAEVKRLSDRVVVLRDGQFVGELKRPEINHDSMVSMMVGRDISQVYKRTPSPTGDTVLKLQGIRTPTWPKHAVSCQVKSGEIVGLAGLVGSGRTELLNTIFGIDQPIGGKILIQGKPVDISSPIVAIDHGLALVPEDRKLHGLVTEMSVQNNIGLASLQRNANRFGIADFRTQKSQTKTMIEKLSVKTPGPHQISKFLSGGNQQKVVLGKWLTMSPQLLLLDEPTRGIDVGAKQEIYQLMEQLAKEGMGVLFVSSELEEILGLADRVYVMHEGKITGELARDQLSEEAIMQLATDSVTS